MYRAAGPATLPAVSRLAGQSAIIRHLDRNRRDFMAHDYLAYLGWREALIAVVALLVIYILITFLRIGRLKDAAARAGQSASPAAPVAAAAYAAVQDEAGAPPSGPAAEAPAGPAAPEVRETRERDCAWNEPPEIPADGRRIEMLEQDIAQLRREIGGLRADVQTLREELRREVSKVQVTQNASPFYNDAMQLALKGQDASDISRLCGISRAEADLVVSLARNRGKPLD